MFEEKAKFSISDLHELHDRKLRNQFMIEQNRECQSYFWDIFTQENYYVCIWEVFLKFRIPTKFNLIMWFQIMIWTVLTFIQLIVVDAHVKIQ